MAMLVFGIVAYLLWTRGASNDLGLTRSDLAMGGFPDVRALRAKTKAVADDYLAKHASELKEFCGGPYVLTADYSLTPKIRALGYRSSFYYYCWDIYLPYSLQPNLPGATTVIVQLSDGTKGNSHDPDKFRVLRVIAMDQKGTATRILE